MSVFEVSFQVIERLESFSAEKAKEEFMKKNNLPNELEMYVDVEDVTAEEFGW